MNGTLVAVLPAALAAVAALISGFLSYRQKRLESQYNADSAAVIDLQKGLVEQRAQVAFYHEQLEAMRIQYTAIQATLDSTRAALSETRVALETCHSERSDLERRVADLERRLN